MTDRECVEFLQWALPAMQMRWAGFRKVRGQVCKRISRRIGSLGLPDVAGYRDHLQMHREEWRTLASLCRVTISRFYRDRGVFDTMGSVILPRLAEGAEAGLRCWSAGCASGEEAYTMQMLWRLRAAPSMAARVLHVLGTDSDPTLLERARKGVYPPSALADLPPDLAGPAFAKVGGEFQLQARFKEGVEFEQRDIRASMPGGPFAMILCRNLVFTYFEEELQRAILRRLLARLRPGGVLVVGAHESLPGLDLGLRAVAPAIFERTRA